MQGWVFFLNILGWPKGLFVCLFSIRWLWQCLVVFNFTIKLYCESCPISVPLKNTLVNFCAAILTLKMEENTQHFCHIMLYYIKKGKKTTETQRKDWCSLWKRCCDGLNVSKVVSEVVCSRFLAGQCPMVGRPVEVDSKQVETLTENIQQHTTWEIADILRIFKSIKLLVK